MSSLLQDLRYAFRQLVKSPGFTIVVVLTLALGIGVNTAIFSFVDRLLLRPLPFPESHRLASLFIYDTRDYNSMSYPDYRHYRDHNGVFSELAAYSGVSNAVIGVGDELETVSGEAVSANYFAMLRTSPSIGRTFMNEEDTVPGRNPVVILGYRFWKDRFRADPTVLGQPLLVNGVAFTIIGVAPQGVAGLRLDRSAKPEFWVPLMMYGAVLGEAGTADLQHYRGNQWLHVAGRLMPGVTLQQAELNVGSLTEQLKLTYWRTIFSEVSVFGDVSKWTTVVVPTNAARFSPSSRKAVVTFLGMLMVVVGLVLLIACANLASLNLAKALSRRREMGVRLALGASRYRIFQQLLTESFLLSIAGGAVGLIVASFTLRFLTSYERPFQIQLLLETGLDGRLLAYALTLSIFTSVLFGAAPLRQTFRADLASDLKLDSKGVGNTGIKTRDIFVVAQVAFSTVLLVGAGLFVRSLRNAEATDVTHDPGRVLMVPLNLAGSKYDDTRGKQFYPRVLSRIAALPQVQRVALVNRVPMGGGVNARSIRPHPEAALISVNFNVVSEEYFETIGLPLLRGRSFSSRDIENSLGVAVINERMAQRFWPGEDAIGKQFELQRPPRVVEVIGIVRDGRFRNYRDTLNSCFYLPLAQHYQGQMSVLVRAANASALAASVMREIRSIDPRMSTGKPQTLLDYRNAGIGQERLSAALLTGLGVVALALAAVGVYGVLAFCVVQRTHEIGVRMALGAESSDVRNLVIRQGLVLILAGVGVGLACAWASTRLIESLLFGVRPNDAVTFAAVSFVLIAVGVVACYIPARRASKVDPIIALRYE
jgi:predicted permease